jgi:zinc protease
LTGWRSQELVEGTLDNGLRVVVQEDSRLPLVAIDLWYHVGSRHDPPGRSGLAHLFEHMLFQGSANVQANEHFARVQQVGGVANGSTWYDRTNYYETLPTHAFELGLWLESDRMGFFLEALDQEKLELQRNVVMNERRQRVDNQPYGRAGELLNELLYPAPHPYGWPVIGWMQEIEAATFEDVRSFFTNYYAPSNAVLVIVGDTGGIDALDAAQRYFGNFAAAPRGGTSAADRCPRPLERSQPEHRIVEDQVASPRLTMAWTVDGYGTDAWYAAAVLASVLGDGMSSRLETRLVRELELATSASVYVLPTECCATFAISVSAHPDTDPLRLRAATEELLEEVRRNGCGAAELARVAACARADHRWSLQTAQARADAIARGTTYLDRPAHALGEEECYATAATPEHTQQVLDRLDPQRAVSVTVVPARPGATT